MTRTPGLVRLLTLLALALIPVTARSASAHPAKPSTPATNRATEDALDAIDALQATPTPATHSSQAPSTPDNNAWHRWITLILLFLPALATAAAVGVSGGIVGTFVLLRREALMALALPQVVAVGAAVGMRYNWPTLPPALVAAAVALLYFVASKRWGAGNWILPALYVAGLSLSFLLIANMGQDVADLQNLFTGVDVAVSPARAFVAVPLLTLVGVACALLWRRWLLIAQAPAAAELAGLRPARWDALFLAFLTTVLLLGTDSLGLVMVLAMLFLPPATVLPWTRRIPAALLTSALLSLAFLSLGFYLSNTNSWPLSQSVGGVGFVTVLLSHLLAKLRNAI
jgi:ABC-type Mn2+/Zn2+ transport system permease subunit